LLLCHRKHLFLTYTAEADDLQGKIANKHDFSDLESELVQNQNTADEKRYLMSSRFNLIFASQ